MRPEASLNMRFANLNVLAHVCSGKSAVVVLAHCSTRVPNIIFQGVHLAPEIGFGHQLVLTNHCRPPFTLAAPSGFFNRTSFSERLTKERKGALMGVELGEASPAEQDSLENLISDYRYSVCSHKLVEDPIPPPRSGRIAIEYTHCDRQAYPTDVVHAKSNPTRALLTLPHPPTVFTMHRSG